MEAPSFPSGTSPGSQLPEECALGPYVYQPLASRQIRLFALLPAQDSAISIRFIHADLPLTSDPEYQALSYAWGTSPARHPVRVLSDRDTPPSVIHVGDSLAGLLLRLRETESEKLLWVDAICINQTDNADKSDQIPLMGDIYRLASRVIVWLGPESADDASIMEYAQRYGPEMQFSWTSTTLVTAPKPAHQALDSQDLLLAAARSLLSRAWFERLWVRQEIALAARAAVFCGSFELEWVDFRAAMMLAITYNRRDTRELLNRVNSLFIPKKKSWPIVRKELLGMKCSDPRDRIYGLLALIEDDRIGSLAVDYSLSTAEVYTLTAKHCLRNITTHNNILFVCELSSGRMTNLPSWAPDWSTDPESTPLTAGLMRASGGTRPFIEFPEGGVMRLAGVLSSRVKTVVSLGQTPDDLAEGVVRALGMLSPPNNAYPGGPMSVGEALIGAVLQGRYKHTKRPPQPLELTEDEARGALRYFVALSKGANTNEQDTKNYQGLLRHLGILKWARVSSNNAIVLFEDGLIGVAPGVASPGDRLFFPLGSDAPLLIRRAVGSPAPRWLVVCATWVNGRMLGEILYGPLPPNYGGVRILRDDNSMITDVRIERLRDGPGDGSADEAWSPRERPRRFGVDNEKDLTPELFASQGVPVEWLDFV